MGIDDGWDDVVVDVPRLAGDHLHDGDALLLRLVRQHRALHDVADGKHPRV